MRRGLAGAALAAADLSVITAALTAGRAHLNLADDLLVYLVAAVTITVVGGFWPAVLAAVAASLLLNWFFTQPYHTFTIQQPQELLALLLFATVAVAVSSVVHLAARRAVPAARSRAEAAALLEFAQTVLCGADTPGAILGHLTTTHGGQAATALDRERLRTQAAQAEALAEGKPDADRPARRGQPRPAHVLGAGP